MMTDCQIKKNVQIIYRINEHKRFKTYHILAQHTHKIHNTQVRAPTGTITLELCDNECSSWALSSFICDSEKHPLSTHGRVVIIFIQLNTIVIHLNTC